MFINEQAMQGSAVLQRTLSYHTPVWSRHKGRAGGAKARPASRRPDTRAFLNTEIKEIAVSDTDMLDVEIEKGYKEFVDGLKRFYRLAHRRFIEPKKGKVSDRLCELIERTEKDLGEMGLELCIWRHEDDTELNFTVYQHIRAMDEVVFIFYLSPCDTLKGEMSSLYKRYIRYIGDCLGTNIVPDGSSNYYVDMVLSMMFDDPEYDDGNTQEQKMTDFYNNGHGHDLFNEVNALVVDNDELRRDLESFRDKTEGDERTLVDVMLDGMNVLPYMSLDSYEFNPVRDGFETNEGYIDVYACVAFTYCSDDGLEELILDSINNDCNCGLYPVGWNKWLHLDNFTKEDFDFVVSGDSKQREFVEWTNRWYSIEHKFDKPWD